MRPDCYGTSAEQISNRRIDKGGIGVSVGIVVFRKGRWRARGCGPKKGKAKLNPIKHPSVRAIRQPPRKTALKTARKKARGRGGICGEGEGERNNQAKIWYACKERGNALSKY